MSISNIDRTANTLPATAAVTVTPDIDIVECNATAAGFQVTLYKISDTSWHELIVRIVDADVSGNTVTITDGSFSTTLDAAGASVNLAMTYDGTWFIRGQYPVTSTATATSSATSAGLAASVAQSTGDSLVLTDSATGSTAASATLSGVSATASNATSQNVSQSTTISTNLSITSSAVLSGVSATASVATSQNVSQSANVSEAQSTAAS